jgi:Domain of unknown function (DUF4166)
LFGNRRRTPFAAGTPVEAKPPENALIACLGSFFSQLPEVVQRAHRGTIQLSGTVNVERGRGLGWLLAALMRMPRSNPKAELVVVAWHFPDQMVWSRSFDGRTFESTFLQEGDFLVEQMGALSLILAPAAEGGRLVYRLAAARLGPITLPRALSPALTAWEGEREGRYEFEVAVGMPLVGRIIRYAGALDVQILAD